MRLFLFLLVLMLAACSKQELNKPFVAKTTIVIDTEIQRDTTDSAGLESARLNIWFDEQYAEQLDFSNLSHGESPRVLYARS